jgi:hypothetical protein
MPTNGRRVRLVPPVAARIRKRAGRLRSQARKEPELRHESGRLRSTSTQTASGSLLPRLRASDSGPAEANERKDVLLSR